VIFITLLIKAAGGRWSREFSRQRQQYWWRGYQIQSRIEGVPVGPWRLLLSGRIVTTHSLIYREIQAARGQTHRIFAVTVPSGGP
jgi:hypothetical protein